MAYRRYTWNFTGKYDIYIYILYNQQSRDLGKSGEAAKPWLGWTLINCWFYGGFIIVIVKTTPVGFLVDINHWLTIRIVGFIVTTRFRWVNTSQFWMNPCGIYCRTTWNPWLESGWIHGIHWHFRCSPQFFSCFWGWFLGIVKLGS